MYSTNNPVLKRRYRELPAIECVQRNAAKVIVTEKEVKKTNKNGMGNDVGIITNYVTSMMEVQSRFPKDSKEYEELEYRIACGQLFQQASLDKIKGIVATPMPNRWYHLKACGDDRYLQSICAYRKPYFMIYIYEELRQKYRDYIKDSESKCQSLYKCSISELYSKENHTPEELDFLWWYEYKMPVGDGPCSMNRICHYIEKQMDGYKSQLKKNSGFDYNKLKTKHRCTEEHRQALLGLEKEYCECIKQYKQKVFRDKGERAKGRNFLCKKFNEEAKAICPNDEERMNIILDISYMYGGNKQFCWDTIGELICNCVGEGDGELCIY